MGTARRPQPRKLPIKLRRIRTSLGLTQEEMAERFKRVPSPPKAADIARFELGLREPSLLLLLAYAREAGLPMEVLVDDKLEVPSRLEQGRKLKLQ